MSFLQQTVIQLITAAIAFGAGIVWYRVRLSWAYVFGRRFWRPMLRRDLTLILGDGFQELQGFEAADVIGKGDLLAAYSVSGLFSTFRARRLQPIFADEIRGINPKGLQRNLIVLGGPDANSITRRLLARLELDYFLDWNWTDPSSAVHPSTGIRHRLRRRLTRDSVARPKGESGWHPPRLIRTHRAGGSAPQFFQPSRQVGEDRINVDYGIIIRTRNPYHEKKSIVVIYGCYGYGTLGAVNFTGKREFLRLLKKHRNSDIECIVKVYVEIRAPQDGHLVYVKVGPRGSKLRCDDAIGLASNAEDRLAAE